MPSPSAIRRMTRLRRMRPGCARSAYLASGFAEGRLHRDCREPHGIDRPRLNSDGAGRAWYGRATGLDRNIWLDIWQLAGPFYPEGIAKNGWLSWYATQFATTEINCSFYRTPSLQAGRAMWEM